MSKPGIREVLRYRLDTFMSKGGRAIFISLVVVFVSLLVLLIGLRWASMAIEPSGVSEEPHPSFPGQAYIIFLEMTDPGNMNQAQNFGVKLIPEKTTLWKLQPDDCLVVVSEDET